MKANYILIILGLMPFLPLFAMQPEQPMVTLVSADGAEFKIPLDAAQESGQIKGLLSGGVQESQEKRFEFSSISTPVMAEIVQLMKELVANKNAPSKQALLENLKSVQITNPKGVLEAADLLEIPLIKQIVAYHYAQQLNSKQLSYEALQQQVTQTGLHPDLAQDLLHQATVFYYVFNPSNLTLQESPYGTSIQDYLDYNPQLIAQRRDRSVLNLSDLHLSSLKGLRNITNINSLTQLYLNNNQLQEIHAQAFAGLQNLQWLYLSTNRLRNIQAEAFSGLRNVHTLSLYNNQLRQIHPHTFDELQNLQGLDLAYNQFQKIQPQLLSVLQNLRNLYLNNNPLIPENTVEIRTALPDHVSIKF